MENKSDFSELIKKIKIDKIILVDDVRKIKNTHEFIESLNLEKKEPQDE